MDYNAPRPTAPLPTAPRPTAPPPQYPNNGPYGAAIINQPRPQGHGVDLAVKPPTYMVLNVFAMVCCCFVCGLVGVLTAMQVNNQFCIMIKYSFNEASSNLCIINYCAVNT